MSNENIAFKNVQVTAIPQRDPATGKTSVKVTLNPPTLTVTEPSTIINYQLVDPTPPELKFTGVAVTPPNDQLSPPAISTDGRNLTLNDVNTTTDDFTVTFQFNSAPELVAPQLMASDPDLLNRPGR